MPYGNNCNLEKNFQSDIRQNSFANMEEPKMKAFGFGESSNFGNMYDLLSIQKSIDRNFDMPELRKLSLSSDSNSTDGLSTFMLESAKSGRDTESIQVKVPTSEHVAEIVGKQGCKIKSLRYSTKTYIQTPARDQEPVFTISGYPEDVERAKRRIEEAAEHFTKIRQGRENNSPITPQLGPNAVVRYVRVPLKYVGLVVGPKGHNIKRIQSETDTFIMTPARDKEPIFEIRGAAEKVAEAENKLQMYIAMRTGGMFDDSDHLVDVDLKKPMLPPKPLDGFSMIQPTFGGSKTWAKPESSLYSPTGATPGPHFGNFGNAMQGNSSPIEPTALQHTNPYNDASRIDGDSGYSSPNYDRKDLQNLKLFLDHIQQNMGQIQPNMSNMNHQQQQGMNMTAQQYLSNRWSHSGNF